MSDESPLVSIMTPTFNREHTLHRCFECLMTQTYQNFEWIVVDDGSTDHTRELVEGYIKEAWFPITYIYKENGGKHTAVNLGYKHTKGEYLIQLDSDDRLTDTAIELFMQRWINIPEADKSKYWCICCLCVDYDTNEIIGNQFPENINEVSSKKQKRMLSKIYGDKCGCQRTEVMIEFPFPEPEGLKFLTENIVWRRLDRKFLQFYTNDISKLVYKNETDSLTADKPKTIQNCKQCYNNFLYDINEFFDLSILSPVSCIKSIISITRYGLDIGKSIGEILSDMDKLFKKALVLLFYPIGLFFYIRDKKIILKYAISAVIGCE